MRLKYASEVTSSNVPITSGTQIEISGKVVEEVGFDKIRLKLAQLQDLKVIILDGMRISHAQADGDSPIRDVSPMITELDLSRNLLETAEPLVDVCRELIHLRALRVKYVRNAAGLLGRLTDNNTAAIASMASSKTRA